MVARPLLMSGPMVRAYLAGKKAETRRMSGRWEASDVAWWREKFRLFREFDDDAPSVIARNHGCTYVDYAADRAMNTGFGRWRSPIHMPRAFSRISTTILDVCREPLHAITEAGAIAEGFSSRAEFADYWDRLHGRGAWDENPEAIVLRWEAYRGE